MSMNGQIAEDKDSVSLLIAALVALMVFLRASNGVFLCDNVISSIMIPKIVSVAKHCNESDPLMHLSM